MPDTPLDPFKDLLGVDFTPERLQQNLDSFRPILEQIRKLRALDLANVHPAVIFEPTAAYRREPGR
jgi:hypothetical protein